MRASNRSIPMTRARFALCALAWAGAQACVAAPGEREVSVTSMTCFHREVRIASVCRPLGTGPLYVECDRETLDTGLGHAELVGKDRGMHAADWSCSADQSRLFVTMVNGGDCDQCERHLVFDARARRIEKDRTKPPKDSMPIHAVKAG